MAAIEFLSGRQKRPRSAFEFIDTNSYAVANPKRPRTGSTLIKDVSEEKLDSSTKAPDPYPHSRTSSSSSSSRSSESESDDSDSSDTLLPTDLAVPGLSPSHTSDSSSTSSSSTSDAESSITSDSELESDSDSDSDAVSISSTDSEASSGSPRGFDLLSSLLPAGIPPLTAPPGSGNLSSLATDLQARLASLIPQLAAANQTLETEREEGILQERDIENLEGEEDEYIEMNLGLGVLEEKNEEESSESDSDSDDEDPDGVLEENDVLARLMGRKLAREKAGIQVVDGDT